MSTTIYFYRFWDRSNFKVYYSQRQLVEEYIELVTFKKELNVVELIIIRMKV